MKEMDKHINTNATKAILKVELCLNICAQERINIVMVTEFILTLLKTMNG